MSGTPLCDNIEMGPGGGGAWWIVCTETGNETLQCYATPNNSTCMAANGNYTYFVHFVPERNVFFERKLRGRQANNASENESFSFLSE